VAEPIINDILSSISRADLVIADLTGTNPNVYYEVGLAQAFGKKLILVAQSREDLAFDLAHLRTIFYASPDDLRSKLEAAIQDTFWRSLLTP
jgi:hypothetical protein